MAPINSMVAIAIADVALFSTLRWWPRAGRGPLALAASCLAAVFADSTGPPRTARRR